MADPGKNEEIRYCYGCMRVLAAGEVICPHCGYDNRHTNNPEDVLPEGTILTGKYLVGRKLGRGGFGVTYLGRDLILDVPVAIKEYFPSGISVRAMGSRSVKPLSDESAARDPTPMSTASAPPCITPSPVPSRLPRRICWRASGSSRASVNWV